MANGNHNRRRIHKARPPRTYVQRDDGTWEDVTPTEWSDLTYALIGVGVSAAAALMVWGLVQLIAH